MDHGDPQFEKSPAMLQAMWVLRQALHGSRITVGRLQRHDPGESCRRPNRERNGEDPAVVDSGAEANALPENMMQPQRQDTSSEAQVRYHPCARREVGDWPIG